MSRFVALTSMLACSHIYSNVQKLTVGQINPKLLIRIGQSHEENSHDFHSTFRNRRGTRDCEHQQANSLDSYTSQWSGGGHLPVRWLGSNLARFLSSCSPARNDGRDPVGPARRTLSFRVSQSD